MRASTGELGALGSSVRIWKRRDLPAFAGFTAVHELEQR
jgi:hypothetical protein